MTGFIFKITIFRFSTKLNKKNAKNSIFTTVKNLPCKKVVMTRNKQPLAAVSRETQEEHSRKGQARNTSVRRNNEKYITQVPEEIEGRVTKKLSQEFSRTESRILEA